MRVALAALAFLLLIPATGFARAPTLEELPTIRSILEAADRQIELDRKAAEEAARDEKMEAILAYEQGRVSIYEFKQVVGFLKDDKEDSKYRMQASVALQNRFKDIPSSEERMQDLKKTIGRELIFALNDQDENVRRWVAAVYEKFFPGQYRNFDFNPKDPSNKRNKAWREWRKFLRP